MTRSVFIVVVCALCIAGCGPTIQAGVEDARLTMRVKTALLNESELGTLPIDVDVRGGVVYLSGRVTHVEQIAQAERVVAAVTGVQGVTVTLDVDPEEVVGRDRPGRLPSIAPPIRDEPTRIVALGASGTVSVTPAETFGNGVAVGPILRLRPRTGWGPTIGFGWTRTRLEVSPSGQAGLADVLVRPVMGGVEYGLTRGRLSTGVSLVGGYSFNSLAVDTDRVGPHRAIAVDNSLALRTGVTLWYDLSPRVGLNVFGGYRLARPQVTFVNGESITTDRLNADAVMISIGLAYWLF